MVRRRVVVTGMGIKSSIGNDLKSFFENLKKGVHGIKPIEFMDVTRLDMKLASYDYDFKPENYLSAREIKRNDRFCQFALAATADAL